MKIRKWLFFLLLMLTGTSAFPQFNPSKVCRVENGRMIFTLDKGWDKHQNLEIIKQFNLDTGLVMNVFSGKQEVTVRKQTWQIRKLDDRHVELSRPFGMGTAAAQSNIILDDRTINASGINERIASPYGINKFTLYNVFRYNRGTATFFLPKYKSAEKVFLSGTFNNWSTLQTPMTKTDSGWIVSMKLTPGKYQYKYIVDGQWIPDPFNRQNNDDQEGGYNSVVFCYNYRFFIPGYPNAKKVLVAGSFNDWNEDDIRMLKVAGGWAANLYLRDGTHAYKFIVDGDWKLDPVTKVVRPDGGGNENSYVSIGDTMHFRLAGFKEAGKCAVSGDFNAWNPNELFMQRTTSGWDMPYVLSPGNYEYKFIVDGKWMMDPVNPFVAYSGGQENSLKMIKPNHLFSHEGDADAAKVIVTGSFNNWSTDNYHMVRRGNTWTLPLYLKPGKYTYKFIIDGKWTEDTDNDKWEMNDVGTRNSVLWIEP